MQSVTIIGGGMVGAACALSLSQSGFKVNLVETAPPVPETVFQEEQIDIRVSAINRSSESLMRQLGAWPFIEQSRKVHYSKLVAMEGKSAWVEFDAEQINTEHLGHIIENKLIQSSFYSAFEGHSINIINKHVAAINNAKHCAEVEFSDGTLLKSDLLVAADGSRSKTRGLTGIGVTGWQYSQQCMGMTIKLDAPEQHVTWQQFKPSGPVAFLPLSFPYASLIWYDSSAETARRNDLNKAKLKDEVKLNFPELPGDFEIVETAAFPLTRQHANDYYLGRVVLIGDAAHAINPLAGQGVNLGFKDVVALTRSLSAHSDLELALRSYERARRPANLAMMTAMDFFYKTFSNDLKPIKVLRQLGLNLANKSGPIKHHVLKYAMGEGV